MLSVTIFVINVAAGPPGDRRVAVLARHRGRDHAAAAARRSCRPASPPDRGGSPSGRCWSSGWCASRTSATSTCCSPTRPAPSPRGRSASNARSTPPATTSRTCLLLGLVCNEATPTGRHGGRRQPARRRPVGFGRRADAAASPTSSGIGIAPVRPRAALRLGARRRRATSRRRHHQGRAGGGAGPLRGRDRRRPRGARRRVRAPATESSPSPPRPRTGAAPRRGRGRARPAPRRLPGLPRPAEAVGRRVHRARWPSSGITVKIVTGDNPLVAETVCHDLGLAVERHADRRRPRRARRRPARRRDRRTPRCSPGSAPSRRHASCAPSGDAGRPWRSSATASTTRSRCTTPTSASPSTRPPMSPRTPPTSSCWRRTSTSSPTASSRAAGSSPTRSSTC